MKKYLVIGNPIDHSLSPKIHNYWLKENNIEAIYEKKKIDENQIESIILDIKEKKISGLNITVPFKKAVIPFLDELSPEAKKTQSVNTVYLDNNKIVGDNTDIAGFKKSFENNKFSALDKNVLILGAGGVVSSIIYALEKLGVKKIYLSNRTIKKAESLKTLFNDLTIIEWGILPEFDIIINATSLGLNNDDKFHLDFTNIGKNKFFYDVIYNPKETDFLKTGRKLGNKAENGMMMFIYQAMYAFKLWNKFEPKINNNLIELMNT